MICSCYTLVDTVRPKKSVSLLFQNFNRQFLLDPRIFIYTVLVVIIIHQKDAKPEKSRDSLLLDIHVHHFTFLCIHIQAMNSFNNEMSLHFELNLHRINPVSENRYVKIICHIIKKKINQVLKYSCELWPKI